MISRMTLQVRTNITALLSSKHTSRQISPGTRHAPHDMGQASVLPDHHDCGNGACTGGWHKKQCKQPINLQQRLENCHMLPNTLSASAYSTFTTVLGVLISPSPVSQTQKPKHREVSTLPALSPGKSHVLVTAVFPCLCLQAGGQLKEPHSRIQPHCLYYIVCLLYAFSELYNYPHLCHAHF